MSQETKIMMNPIFHRITLSFDAKNSTCVYEDLQDYSDETGQLKNGQTSVFTFNSEANVTEFISLLQQLYGVMQKFLAREMGVVENPKIEEDPEVIRERIRAIVDEDKH